MNASQTSQVQDPVPPGADARGDDRRPTGPGNRHQPLGGYLFLMSVYTAATAAGLWEAHRRGRLPQRLRGDDLALVALSTQRLSRLLTKDRVTTVMRAPFTEFQHDGGPGEVEETPRGRGIRRAVGELLVCPFCIAQWIATGLGLGLLFAPRVTRFFSGVISAVAAADLLQLLYKGSERRALG